MHQGNWKCSGCGGAITELPFQPKSEKGLTCRTCYAKQKGGNTAPVSTPDMPVANEAPDMPPDDAGLAGEQTGDDGLGEPIAPGEKPKFTGSWQCAGCGGAITSLPFEPRTTNNLKCLDCFKASKG